MENLAGIKFGEMASNWPKQLMAEFKFGSSQLHIQILLYVIVHSYSEVCMWVANSMNYAFKAIMYTRPAAKLMVKSLENCDRLLQV